MQHTEVTNLHYVVPFNPATYPTHFNSTQNNTSEFQFSKLSSPFYHLQITPQVHNINPQPTSLISNSSSSPVDDKQQSLMNERKQRRMISNRDSARRSRMRKQRHLDELWTHVLCLSNENHQLIDKLNHVSEIHDRVIQENAQLKGEVSELRQMLTDMQLDGSYPTLRDLDVDGILL